MLDVRLMRLDGVRLSPEEVNQRPIHSGDFVLDVAHGAKRLRVRNPWSSNYAPIELYEPVLVSAQGGTQRWRGYERVGEKGVVQEWLVRLRN